MMTGAIDRIQITGFKSIRSADIMLRPLNVLIGPNGVGKSNFIALFRLLNQLIDRFNIDLIRLELREKGAEIKRKIVV